MVLSWEFWSAHDIFVRVPVKKIIANILHHLVIQSNTKCSKGPTRISPKSTVVLTFKFDIRTWLTSSYRSCRPSPIQDQPLLLYDPFVFALKRCRCTDELLTTLEDAWNAMPQDVKQWLVRSIPHDQFNTGVVISRLLLRLIKLSSSLSQRLHWMYLW